MADDGGALRRLVDHLEDTYDIDVLGTLELDRDVHRIDLPGRDRWVARLRPPAAAERDEAVITFLAASGFPAERPAADPPLTMLDDRAVLVTRFVPGVRGEARRDIVRAHGGLAALGEGVAQLAALGEQPGAPAHPGGGWHHLCDGTPADEIAAAATLLAAHEEDLRAEDPASFDALCQAVAGLDAGDDLPVGLVHPDPVLANVVASPQDGLIRVDWAGAGRGPVLWSLAWLLWAEAARDVQRADRVLTGYRRHAELEADELERLPDLARARATTIAVGAWHLVGVPITKAAARAARGAEIADALAAHLRSDDS